LKFGLPTGGRRGRREKEGRRKGKDREKERGG